MSTEENTKFVPQLRFPEFRREKEWDSTRLGNLCEAVTKGSTPTTYGFDYVNSGVRFVKIESLSDGLVDCTKTSFITDECNDAFARSQLKENDILFSIAGALGVIALVDRTILPANINQAIGVIRLKQGYSHRFLLHQLQTELIQSEIQRIKAGAAQPNISLTQLGDFMTLLPSLAEQQKIADCMSSLDELIAAQTRKVEALKTHKKGLMQQLFPREGETQPRLRFSEFVGDWEIKTLKHACKMQAGKFISASEIKDKNSDGFFPCFGGNGLRGYTETHTHEGTYPLIGRQGALCGNVKLAESQFYATEHALVAAPNAGVHTAWLYYLLDFMNLNQYATGQAQPGLSVDVLNALSVAIPTQEQEQQRIAVCLTSLDDLITVATQELENLKTHKKGLMQQLFPSAVTTS